MSENTSEGKICPKCNIGHFHFVAKEESQDGDKIYNRYECDNPKCRNSCKDVARIFSDSIGGKDFLEKKRKESKPRRTKGSS